MGGSKSAKGGPNPLADMDRGGSKSASGFGPPGGSKSAVTAAFIQTVPFFFFFLESIIIEHNTPAEVKLSAQYTE